MKTRPGRLQRQRPAFQTQVALLQRKLKWLDWKWMKFRQASLLPNRHGGREPSSFRTLCSSASLAVLGLLTAVLPWIGKQPSTAALFRIGVFTGLLVVLAGLGHLLRGLARASHFRRVRARYQIRRRELLARLDHEKGR